MDSEHKFDTEPAIQFITSVCYHLDNRFPQDELQEWKIFDHMIIKNSDEFDFGKKELSKLVVRYSNIINNYDDNVKILIIQQYSDFKFIVNQKIESGVIKTFNDTLNIVLNDDTFKEPSNLIDICGRFEVSSSECERGFSMMDLIKSKSRNRLGVSHLADIMHIKSHIKAGKEINLDMVYDYWVKNKSRGENFTG